MNVKQAIVTSCTRGLFGGSGVCLYSMSERLDAGARERFERASVYQNDFRYQGPVEELPVMMLCGKEGSGDFYLQQVRSILDYGGNGRSGNILSQLLLIPKEEELPWPPVTCFGGPDFLEKMDPDKVMNRETPDYLPELSFIRQNEALSFEKICAFVQEVDFPLYFRVLDVVLHLHKQGRRLVIRDTPERILLWASAILYALPFAMNRELSFSAYVYDLTMVSADICGHVEGISKAYEASPLDVVLSGDTLFDEGQDLGSTWFGNLKMAFLTEDYDYIASFNAFLTRHGFTEPDSELYLLYELYMLLDSGTALKTLRYSGKELLLGAVRYLTEEERCTLAENVIRAGLVDEEENTGALLELLKSVETEKSIALLTALDEAAEKEPEADFAGTLDTLWKNFLSWELSRDPLSKGRLLMVLPRGGKRRMQLTQIEIHNNPEKAQGSFEKNYRDMLRSGTDDSAAKADGLLKSYVEEIRSRYSGEEQWGQLVKLFGLVREAKGYGEETDRLVSIIDRSFPITNEEIGERNRDFRKGNEERLRQKFGDVQVDLHKLAGDLFNYRNTFSPDLPLRRADLYLAGYTLWKKMITDRNFDYMEDASILRDYYAKCPIDMSGLQREEAETYFDWIMPVLSDYVFDERRLSYIFSCFRMEPVQKRLLIAMILRDLLENYDKKEDFRELYSIFLFCKNTDPELYRSLLRRALREMKKSDYQSLDGFMNSSKAPVRDGMLEYWESLKGEEKKQGFFGKLFGK